MLKSQFTLRILRQINSNICLKDEFLISMFPFFESRYNVFGLDNSVAWSPSRKLSAEIAEIFTHFLSL